MKTQVLVTGANGQLAKTLRDRYIKNNLALDFLFVSKAELDITNKAQLKDLFNHHHFDYCINCAAYTAVDKAESDNETAYSVNVNGSKYLAEVCQLHQTTLIHISTDFVFDGTSKFPYKETDTTKPLSVYGITKLKGEQAIIKNLEKYFIIRTSWLYSEYGHNFMKTMLRLAQEKDQLHVVSDQIGTPTYTGDLIEVIFKLIISRNENYGIYHFSNSGETNWFDFAKAIFEYSHIKTELKPIPTEAYPTSAKRPQYSVLDTTKIKSTLDICIPNWKDTLKVVLSNRLN
ncbi:dTDP-4-dehydrorhamnose reductase [Formosa maritima]|uniref:dTDP-4-dehydrorhamnose reductase n=1 Tax=Formosa maritima TaxID=2592046 RepID=A0A5D0G058_9FLAO|nr:dTDP-4-dehydrorhamnose reductase [Formosa maritima]TYA52215.1 dTDP-4-dehydrorhamnose reductase [Formosa maritima]